MVKLNVVKERMLYLSPTVQAGWEDESNMENFEISKNLGNGAFGKVFRVTHKSSKLVYAIKQISKSHIIQNQMQEQVKNEVKIMYSLNHPQILKLYNHFEDDSNVFLILELAPGGQLYQLLWKQPHKKFDEKSAAKFILQLAQALEEIHSKNIIHRDIKPENILLDHLGNLKLADFGWSNFLPDSKSYRNTFCGTLDYLAPEMLDRSHKHDHTVDIWGVGILCYELLTGMAPFSPKENQFDANYVDQKTRENIRNMNLKFPEFPEQAKNLVLNILKKEPKDRYTTVQIQEHPWITSLLGTGHLQKKQKVETISEALKINQTELLAQVKDSNKLAFSHEEIYKFSRPDSIINKGFDESFKTKPNFGGLFGKSGASAQDLTKFVKTEPNQDVIKRVKDLEAERQELLKRIDSLQLQNEKVRLDQIQKNQINSASSTSSISGVNDLKFQTLQEKYLSIQQENEFNYNKLQESNKKAHLLQTQINEQREIIDKFKEENLKKAVTNATPENYKAQTSELLARLEEYKIKFETQQAKIIRLEKENQNLKLKSQKQATNTDKEMDKLLL